MVMCHEPLRLDTDVLVIGAGGAGLRAAIEAAAWCTCVGAGKAPKA